MLLTLISFIFVFGIIVMSHEFGHYITARLNDVKILEFSLGMGPAVFTKEKGETLYSVRALPIGGYVKMEGEDGESSDPRSFVQKRPIQRLLILAAGALMNFLLAYVLLVIIMMGMGFASTTLDEIIPYYPAAEAGIETGDTITAIDNEPITSWEEVVERITASNGEPMAITVERDHQLRTYTLVPIISEDDGQYKIGVTSALVKQPGKAFSYAGKQFFVFFTDIFNFFIQLGHQNVEGEIIGPVGMVNVIGQASRVGFLNLLFIAAYISVNLGIVNLLPFPALDGGRIVFVLIEMVKGSPVDREKEGYVHFIGITILMALMVFLVFRDISNL
ncbi:RIP metalloprotease RseP [Fusibacter paucivorans]|uniref:Zinc metalloprotease n=1 Tax=Fusibacter paucivorans TaxID=76009 RepID=A0ABS5PS77_9FIRM|nr:RIP metalloprotease RseP [Fusibacter paucivorans]MBS7528015.1 RIP metalloprotease RseP [Fusibacter paucivorans]